MTSGNKRKRKPKKNGSQNKTKTDKQKQNTTSNDTNKTKTKIQKQINKRKGGRREPLFSSFFDVWFSRILSECNLMKISIHSFLSGWQHCSMKCI